MQDIKPDRCEKCRKRAKLYPVLIPAKFGHGLYYWCKECKAKAKKGA